MKKFFLQRVVSFLAVVSMITANVSDLYPETGTAEAAEGVRAIMPGTVNIASPTASESGWSGDFMYYGDADGQPLKWRVLDLSGNAGNSSVAGGILLQADVPVHSGGQEKRLQYRDVSGWLNDNGKNGFLGGFTAEEQQAVISSVKKAVQDSPTSLLRKKDLTGEKVFLPDAADLANASYGYRYDGVVHSMASAEFWWLRSEYKTTGRKVQGCVLPGGTIYYSFDDEKGSIVPAFNLQKDRVLFTSAVGMDKAAGLSEVGLLSNKEWKLTLLEETLSVTAGNPPANTYQAFRQLRREGEEDEEWDADEGDDSGDEGDDSGDEGDDGGDEGDHGGGYDPSSGIVRDGSSVTVPYTVTDASGKANQLSLMISEGDYTEGRILFYGKAADLAGSGSGYFTFTLPEGFDRVVHRAYLVPEQVNGGAQTDYAGTPVSFDVPPLHVHSWGPDWSYDEDAHWHECTVPGCNLTAEDAEDKGGYEEHDLEEVVEKEATCFQEGSYYEVCTVCHYRTELEEEPMLDHERGEEDPGVVLKEATCTEEGELQFYCAICGTLATEEIDMLDHDFGDWVTVKEATFHKPGLEKRVCIRCGEVEKEEIPAGKESHTHEYTESITKEASCEEDGVTTFTCIEEQCGDTYTEKIKALGHTYGEWTQTVAPTETTEGQRQRTCSRCGKVQTQTLPVIEHTHDYKAGGWHITESEHWLECSCGDQKEYDTHNWDKGEITVRPTKTAEGAVAYHCKQCGYAMDGVIPVKGSVVESGNYRYRFTGIRNGVLCSEVLGFAKGKKSKIVRIPNIVTVNGARLTIRSMKARAFVRDKNITKIILPDSLERIGTLAFFRASHVKKVRIGKKIKRVDRHAFCHLKSLKKFTIEGSRLKVKKMHFFHGTRDFILRVPARQKKKYKRFFPGGKCRVVGIK